MFGKFVLESVARPAETYPGFLIMKQLGVSILPLDEMLVHRKVAPQHFISVP